MDPVFIENSHTKTVYLFHQVGFLYPVRPSSIHWNTVQFPLACRAYNETMRTLFALLGVCALMLSGCQKQPKTDYTALDQSGMWSSSLDELKKKEEELKEKLAASAAPAPELAAAYSASGD